MSAPVTAARTEYATGLRVEPCLCGGELTAPAGNWEDIKNAVVLHQETLLHIVYRANHRLDEPVRFGAAPTIGPSASRDLSDWPTAGKSAPRRTRLVHR